MSTHHEHYGSRPVNDRTSRTDDERIRNIMPLPPPEHLIRFFPIQGTPVEGLISDTRHRIKDILHGKDDRLLVIVGPCSIHDPHAAVEYARRLKAERTRLAKDLEVVMRVYFEKPRTTVGWKGLINDPDMDDSFHVEKGIRLARRLLLDLAEAGMPAGTEALDPIMPQYLHELIAWTAVGARTTESQTHREMASGLSTPVGFKNGTDGTLAVAINALQSARSPHHFLGITQQGRSAVFRTRGNPYGHIVLRGGGGRTNYDPASIAQCEAELERAGLPPTVVVDCSHGNSSKDPARQPAVAAACIDQIAGGNRSIVGFMLESNLRAGSQSPSRPRAELAYGVSVTDACIDWETTERALLDAHRRLLPIVGPG